MQIIKEFCESSGTAVIRSNTYGSNFGKFVQFYNEAKKDFPSLEVEDVEIVKYGGNRYTKTFGI
jgi:hypothetical protein